MNTIKNNIYLTMVAILMIIVPLQSQASIKHDDVSLLVNSTVKVELASAYQNTLRRSTVSSYLWSSADNSIFTVTSSNKLYANIKGIKAGKARLNYTCSYTLNGFYRTMDFYFDVTVEEDNTITISPRKLTLNVGETYTIKATQTKVIGGAYFTSSNTNIAKVTSGTLEGSNSHTTVGTITALKQGTVYIYANTLSGLSDVCTLTVKNNGPTSISVSPTNLDLEIGDQYTVKATITGNSSTYTWTTSNSAVATVEGSELNAVVTAKGIGCSYIYVNTANNLQSYCKVTVKEKEVLPTSITLSDSLRMVVNEVITLSPTILPSNSTYSLTWASSDSDIVAINEEGVMTAKTIGKATIIVSTNNSLSASCIVEVNKKGILGDVNCDGYLNVTDIICLIDYVLGSKVDLFDQSVSDINGDGEINITDVMNLVDIVLDN